MPPGSVPSTSVALAVMKPSLLHSDATLKTLIAQDPVTLQFSTTEQSVLPPDCLEIATQLHQTYLYWHHQRKTQRPTQPTFYRYLHQGITQATERVSGSDASIQPKLLLLLETRMVLATINALLHAAADYFKMGHLQDGKDSVDTALSVLYEYIHTREQLKPSQDAAIQSIRADIAEDRESSQYTSFLVKYLAWMKDLRPLRWPKLYVVRQQLNRLSSALQTLRSDSSPKRPFSSVERSSRLDALMTQLLFVVAKEEAFTTVIKHDFGVRDVVFSPDGAYLATLCYRTVKLLHLETGHLRCLPHQVVKRLLFSPNGHYLSIDIEYSTIQVVEVATGTVITTLKDVWDVIFSPDSQYLVATVGPGDRQLIQLPINHVVKTFAHADGAYILSISPDGSCLAMLSESNQVSLLDVFTHQQLTAITHWDSVNAVSFSPDSVYVATASDDGTVCLVERATGDQRNTIPHSGGVKTLLFSPDSRFLVTTSEPYIVTLIHVLTGEERRRIEHRTRITNILFSPNGAYLATTTDAQRLILVKVRTSEAPRIWRQRRVQTLAFSPDNTYLAILSDQGKVALIDVETGEDRKIPYCNTVNAFSFSPEGRYLATASEYRMAALIDLATTNTVTTIRHGYGVDAVSFSADGMYLATGSKDTTAKVINIGKLVHLGQRSSSLPMGESSAPQPFSSALVHLNQPAAFFLGWLHTVSNRHILRMFSNWTFFRTLWAR